VTLLLEGFSVITGRSNLGKSALARAIAGAFYGIPGDFFVSAGTDRSAVGVKLKDGNLLEWYKVRQGKNSPGKDTNIKINGQKATKIGREHATLTEKLGVKEIKTTYAALRPQYAAQSDLPFLLSENPATVAELLQVLGRVDVVTEAQKRAKGDLRSNLDELRLREVDLDQAKDLLKKLDGTDKIRLSLTQLQEEEKLIEVKQTSLEQLKLHSQRLLSLSKREVPPSPQVTAPAHLSTLSILTRIRQLKPASIPTLPRFETSRHLPSIDQCHQLVTIRKELTDLKGEMSLIDGMKAALMKNKQEMEQELGLCPTCGRTFEGNAAHC